MRVEVPLRNKLYSGVVIAVHNQPPEQTARPIVSIIDEEPIVYPEQVRLWEWIAEYYCCTIGEVMAGALPKGLKLVSETCIRLNPYVDLPKFHELSAKENIIVEALGNQQELSIEDIRKILKQITVYPLVKKLLERRTIYIHEELKYSFKPKVVDFIKLSQDVMESEEEQHLALDKVKRSEKQQRVLAYLLDQESLDLEHRKTNIISATETDHGVMRAMQKKSIIDIVKREVSRLNKDYYPNIQPFPELSMAQSAALDDLNQQLKVHNTILLHGITGSGKTRLYLDKIQEVDQAGGQVLFLLPEIALTTQMVHRIRNHFGDKVVFYHSRMSLNERVELWHAVRTGHSIIIGARSSLFLPFKDLRLIIVDEEHDGSYKQQDPSPRYNARDTAIYMGHLMNAKVILGTATPSLETYQNARVGKYGWVSLSERYGKSQLPQIDVIDLSSKEEEIKGNTVLSQSMYKAIEDVLEKKEQVLLFQNRRGFAPTLKCYSCAWHAECINCDVGMTVHQFTHEMRCHYCGYRLPLPKACPSCNNMDLRHIGFGTEKVEEVLVENFPKARVARIDYDSVKSKFSYEQVMDKIHQGHVDIIVGTQMVTKGLDFDNITLVGVLNADALFNFPNFRASERAFQLLTQVSGRAGRREKKSQVLIQTLQVDHTVIQDVIDANFERFANRELSERKDFVYPPFYRVISVELKHKKNQTVITAAYELSNKLKIHLGRRVIGPATPHIARVRNQYVQSIMIKVERNNKAIKRVKDYLTSSRDWLRMKEGLSSVRVNINVDPN